MLKIYRLSLHANKNRLQRLTGDTIWKYLVFNASRPLFDITHFKLFYVWHTSNKLAGRSVSLLVVCQFLTNLLIPPSENLFLFMYLKPLLIEHNTVTVEGLAHAPNARIPPAACRWDSGINPGFRHFCAPVYAHAHNRKNPLSCVCARPNRNLIKLI